MRIGDTLIFICGLQSVFWGERQLARMKLYGKPACIGRPLLAESARSGHVNLRATFYFTPANFKEMKFGA
jgi:hypothetical protein